MQKISEANMWFQQFYIHLISLTSTVDTTVRPPQCTLKVHQEGGFIMASINRNNDYKNYFTVHTVHEHLNFLDRLEKL